MSHHYFIWKQKVCFLFSLQYRIDSNLFKELSLVTIRGFDRKIQTFVTTYNISHLLITKFAIKCTLFVKNTILFVILRDICENKIKLFTISFSIFIHLKKTLYDFFLGIKHYCVKYLCKRFSPFYVPVTPTCKKEKFAFPLMNL